MDQSAYALNFRKFIYRRCNVKGLRVFLLIITLALSCWATSANAQKVTLSAKGIALKTLLRKITRQAGYEFIASPAQLLNTVRPVDIDVVDVPLTTVLDKYLKEQGLTYTITNKLIVIKRESKYEVSDQGAQQNMSKNNSFNGMVHGQVINERRETLSGASVAVKNTHFLKATNASGEFELAGIQQDAVLVISFIGYSPVEVPVNGHGVITIILKDALGLLEDVNVAVSNGYQTLSKERVTGSFAVISGKELQRTPSTNIYDKLEGKIPGVLISNRRSAVTNTTGTSPITIRGRTSYSAGANTVNNTPLVVIDGFPYYQYNSEDILQTINPEDIEQITILKDASAASIWGAQASYGVIVVTTKKGKHNERSGINFSTTLSVTGKPRLETMNQMSASQYIDLESELVTKGIVSDPSSYIYSSNVSQAETILFNYKKGLISQSQRDAQLSPLAATDNYAQIKKYLLQSPATQQYNLSLSGGGENNTYYLSGYYYTDRPTYKSNINKGWNITANNSVFLLNKRLTLNTAIAYIGAKSTSNSAAINAIGNSTFGLRRYDKLVDSTGTPVQYAVQFTPSVLTSLENSGYMNWRYSPVDELNYSNTVTNSNNLRFSLSAIGKIAPWLSLELSGNYEKAFSESVTYNEAKSYYSRNVENTATSISSGGALVYGIPLGGIQQTTNGNGNTYNLRTQLNFNKIYKGIHRINAIAGAEKRQQTGKSATNYLYGYDPQLGSNASINQTTSYMTVYGYTSQLGNTNSLTTHTHRWVSYYANASYSLLDKYAATASIRFDDADVVGLSEKNRARPFWSTGVRWDIRKETFLTNAHWIQQLSLRATYGINGAAPQNGVTVPIILTSTTANNSTGQNYATISTPANPNLGWEKTSVTNFGMDYSLFKNRLSGSVEYYIKKTRDIIYNEPTNATYGFSTLYYNTGSMKGHGWDVKISGIPLRIRDFEWASTFVFSYSTNKVTDARLNTLAVASAQNGQPYVGYPLDYLFVYRWAGLDKTGQSQVYAADGKTVISKSQTVTDFKALKYAGRTSSPYFGGFNNTFSYKQFQLAAQMNWYMGSVFLRPSIDNYPVSGFYSGAIGKQQDLAYRWKKANDELTTNVPGLTGINSNSSIRYKNSDLLVTSGSFIRLQQVSLGYSLPEKWINGIGIKGLNASAVLQNLGLLWTSNKLGLDPEYQRSSSNVNDNIKPSVTYSFRLSANF